MFFGSLSAAFQSFFSKVLLLFLFSFFSHWVAGRLVRLANVPFAGWQRISKYFVRGQKN
jgi:hypothetical protein